MRRAERRVWYTLLFVCMQGCLHISTAEVSCNECVGGCDCSQRCSPIGSCKEENVALGKRANVSSLYTSSGESSGPACLAVNGNRGTTFRPISDYPRSPNCVHTNYQAFNASWWVDLEDVYPVSRVTVYNRDENRNSLGGTRIYVDNQFSFTLPSNLGWSQLKIELSVGLDKPKRGRIVSLRKDNAAGFMNFCEFEVWVCLPGRFGRTCDELCSDHRCKDNATCDRYDGTCPSGCEDGVFGPSCNQACGQCKENTICNSTTGECPEGCQSGWRGPNCNTTCSPGTFGPNCRQRCGNCRNINSCNSTTGVCETGCAPGYQTVYCNKTCDRGMYGANCTQTCGHCKDDASCDVTSGHCPGACQAGWQLPSCSSLCGRGTYGENCSFRCGRCRNAETCDVVSGHCTSCEGNFTGSTCQDCVPAWYGTDCNKNCPHCDNDGSCDKDTGLCRHGCRAGWETDKCDRMCQPGKFGKSCAEQCGNCSLSAPCRHDNGRCEKGCAEGFEGDTCQAVVGLQSPEERSSKALIIGVVVAAAVVGVFVIVIIIILRKRPRSQRRKTDTDAVLENNRAALRTENQEETVLSFTPNPGERSKDKSGNGKAGNKKKVEKVRSLPEDFSDNIYVNVALTSSASQTSLDTLADEDNGVQRSMESLVDDGNLYGNDESVYATFQASTPHLDRVQRHLVDRLASGQLAAAFDELPKGLTDHHHTAKLKINFKKNRFASVLPYEEYRVVLRDEYCEMNATDYINASYIKGFHNEKTYVAAQGPRDNTVVDFWRMVWQEQITQIIMLTKLIEGGKEKCFEYWPSPGSLATFGPFTVAASEVRHRANFVIRKFSIRAEEEERKVEQYHYLGWPDHGVPPVASLLSFWHFARSRTLRRPLGPLLVHCSAGVGRTGAYIGLDIAFDEAINKSEVNIDEIVKNMRKERCLMVQTVDQFIFLYKAVLEAYTGRDTVIPLDRFDVTFPQPILFDREQSHVDREFKTLMQMRSLTAEVSRDVAKQEENLAKNRNPACLPPDGHLAFLTVHIEGRNQFINAVFMSSYREVRGTILTQLPLPATLVDFWRLVDGNEVSTIVSLGFQNEERSVQNFCKYWPEEGRMIQTGPYAIKHQKTSALSSHLLSHSLLMTREDEPLSRELRMLRYNDWPDDVPGDLSDLLLLVDTLEGARTKSEKATPVVVQCLDGVSRSALFCAICNILCRLKLDQDVDIYMTIREIQSVRPEAVATERQYRYCYMVAQQAISDVNVYANA